MKKLALFLSAAFFCIFGLQLQLQAAAVRGTDVTTASSGNVLIGVEGTYSTVGKSEILNRINAIRLEACREGVISPETGKALTASDYVEMKWSSALEWIAQIRASEATVNEDHVRPNGTSCFSLSYGTVGTYAENLAWNYSGLMQAIEQWYGEKEDWVNQNASAVTGHYISLISTRYNYIGIGAFRRASGGWYGVAAEFTYGTGLDETKSALSGNYIQMMEVQSSAVQAPSIGGTKTIYAGQTSQLSLSAVITFDSIMGGKNTTQGVIPGTITWKSSNTAVASVSSSGLVSAKTSGTAIITAMSSSGSSAACTITVKAPVKGTKMSVGNATYKVTTANKEVAFTGSADTVIKIPDTVTVGGVKYKVTSIANSAFSGNKKITSVTIGKNVTTIGAKAFYKCTSLKKVTIGAKVKTIGKKAFQSCKILKTVTIKTKKLTLKTVKANAWKGIANKAKVKVPSGCKKTYKTILLKRGLSKKAVIK